MRFQTSDGYRKLTFLIALQEKTCFGWGYKKKFQPFSAHLSGCLVNKIMLGSLLRSRSYTQNQETEHKYKSNNRFHGTNIRQSCERLALYPAR